MQQPQGKHVDTFFWTASLALPELEETMFIKRFETSLKLLAHIGPLKIGSATTQAAPVIFQEPEAVACTPAP